MNLLRQARPRLRIGALRDMVQRAQGYYAMAGILINLATLYTVREGMIRGYFPWINFAVIIGIVLITMFIIILVDHKIVYPSQVAYHQHLAWNSKSPVRQNLEQRQQELDKKLEEILDELHEVKRAVSLDHILKE